MGRVVWCLGSVNLSVSDGCSDQLRVGGNVFPLSHPQTLLVFVLNLPFYQIPSAPHWVLGLRVEGSDPEHPVVPVRTTSFLVSQTSV